MAHHRDHLEPLPDGFVGFYTTSGEHWKHRDVVEAESNTRYRLFVSDHGEEKRYTFGPKESPDATLLDLREQLGRATAATAPARQ